MNCTFFKHAHPWLTSVTFITIAMLNACAPLTSSSTTSNEKIREVHAGHATYDQQLARMAQQVPGFGGMYVDAQGDLIVYLKQGEIEKAVAIPEVARTKLKAALQRVFGADLSSQVSLKPDGKPITTNPQMRFIEGKYSALELNRWFPDVQFVLELEAVIFTDIDEAKNRITIGIMDESARSDVRAALNNTHIPAEAIQLEIAHPKVSQAMLTDTSRPSHSGMRISVFQEELHQYAFPQLCTLGFNAHSAERGMGFVTNAHCGVAIGSVDPWEVHQLALDGSRTSDYTFAGWELIDPPLWRSINPWVCPAFSRCRYSDAVFIGNYGFKPTTLGEIARPLRKNHVSSLMLHLENEAVEIDASNPTIDITGEKLSIKVGDYVNKIGSRTGWTFGKVTKTCVNSRHWKDANTRTDIVFKCQSEFARVDDTYLLSAGGDSGSPVFAYYENYNGGDIQSFAHLVGIHHSGTADGASGVFSHLKHVKAELNLQATY